jgi:hypothetical protein
VTPKCRSHFSTRAEGQEPVLLTPLLTRLPEHERQRGAGDAQPLDVQVARAHEHTSDVKDARRMSHNPATADS